MLKRLETSLIPKARPRLKHITCVLMAHGESSSENRKPSLWEATYTD